ncbi:MAG: hypothetical protein Q8K00_07705 [Syntrophales bacterium]|nr:hypothetical protein [Syntrophales bacterium]
MSGLSHKLKGYTFGNPFQESQARTYGDDKIVDEFFPTSFFWSLFNEQHEILLGTRGSGKTILLKMLTYSCLRRFHQQQAKDYVAKKSFLGFYVPLHLEFVTSLPEMEVSEAERLLYFQLAFNCVSAKSLLIQVADILSSTEEDTKKRLQKEALIVDHIAPMWCPDKEQVKQISSIRDLEWYVDLLYNNMDTLNKEGLESIGQFSKKLLSPIVNILPRLTNDLGFDPQNTNWIACIDEAEFLSEPFIRCINTFLRSEKRPLVVKMATLPSKHSTRETLVPGVSVEPGGNDFNYRIIDTPWNSADFEGLCNNICRVRLARCGIGDSDLTLEKFLGVVEQNDDLIDYFRRELPEESTEEKILEGIKQSLSQRRGKHLSDLIEDKEKRGKPYLNKYSPVYFMRRMREENSKGARVVGWFAGAKMIRRIADGNPRRFIQIMNALVEQARKGELDPKDQHRVLTSFSKLVLGESEALQRYGLVLRGLITQIGELLADRVHGEPMVNGGCNFRVATNLIEDHLVFGALKLAIDFLHMRVDEKSLLHGIGEHSEFRLCFLYGIEYWIPMRKGDAFVLRSRQPLLDLGVPTTRQSAERALAQIQLELLNDTHD